MPRASRPVTIALAAVLAAIACALSSGCTAPALALSAAGIATDNSMTLDIVKHLHAKLTENDPTPCILLNSVQRAVNPRCEFVAGSIKTADIEHSGLQACPLAIATRDPRLWRAIPELLDKGAKPERCATSPMVTLAQADACPDFGSASPQVLQAMTYLAESDPRAVQHDVFRMLGCTRARAVGLDHVLVDWLDRGQLEPGTLAFSPLDALDPDLLVTRFGHELEVAGHLPERALDNYDGVLPGGFEEALRRSDWAALDWWLYRLPRLANLVPPTRGGELGWVPLQRVLLPGYLAYPTSQDDMVRFLVARGADPKQKLPFDSGRDVIAFAKAMKSPAVALLEAPPAARAPAMPVFAGASANDAVVAGRVTPASKPATIGSE